MMNRTNGDKNKSFQIKADKAYISEAVSFVEKSLADYKIPRKNLVKAMLLTEEILVCIIDTIDKGERIRLSVSGRFGDVEVKITARGEEISFDKLDIEQGIGYEYNKDLVDADLPPDVEGTIRNTIIRSFSEVIALSYKNGVNKIRISAGDASYKGILNTVIAFGLAILVGLMFRLCATQEICAWMDVNILGTVKTIFLNALKMVMVPVIFFSIASCISTFTDMKELGKIGAGVTGFYTFTTLVAIAVGFLFFNVINPGVAGMFVGEASSAVAVSTESVSIRDTLINIVPNNIVEPLLEANTLQIIFIAILTGAAAGKLGEKSEKVSEFLSCANELFLKITTMITKYLPLMILASISSLIISIDMTVLKSLLSLFFTIILAGLAMLMTYCILVLVFTGSNPIVFISKAFPAWLNAFALQSSNASMAFSMNTCDKKLHISPKVYTFSIPLGATINMDGLTITLTISTMFFAKMYGVTLSAGQIAALVVTIVLLSMGTPGIPGGGIICLSVLLKQFNIPLEAIALFVGIYSMIDPFGTANNVMGDIVGTYIIDKKVYGKKRASD